MSDEHKDSYGHVWSVKHPASSDRCHRCDVSYGDLDLGETCASATGISWTPMRNMLPKAPDEKRWAEIEQWLRNTFEADLARLKPKAIEYGASDLKIMGRAMEALLPDGNLLDEQSRERAGLEMACGFYLMGKAARLYGAWEKGREPSEDTWHDAGIYTMMARYIRANGRWM